MYDLHIYMKLILIDDTIKTSVFNHNTDPIVVHLITR